MPTDDKAITGRLHPKTAVRGKRPPNRSPAPALITRTLVALVPVQTESVRQLAVELHAQLPLLRRNQASRSVFPRLSLRTTLGGLDRGFGSSV
jgi:hypothetical protein